MSNADKRSQIPSLISELRRNRVINDFRWDESHADMTVFLGVFNVGVHYELIRRNLSHQNWEGCNLVIVDNASSDSSWELMNQIGRELPCPVRVARNPRNVGGAGSWLSNLDLVSSEWVATMHQDDYYYPEHVQTLRRQVLKADSDVALCTTSMDRLLADNKIQLFPRANWILDASDSTQVFLAHLRFHTLPFPAAAFRKIAVESLPISWHDTSFGDTELVLRLAADYKFVSDPKSTMAYRENPESESHILGDLNRVSGQGIGLLKVFGSDAFERLVRAIHLEERDHFFLHAMESIEIRLAQRGDAESTKRFLAEILSIHWNYSSRAVSEFLKITYVAEDNHFAVSLLSPADNNESESPHENSSEDLTAPFAPPVKPAGLLSWIFRQVSSLTMRLAANSGKRRDLDFDWRRRR